MPGSRRKRNPSVDHFDSAYEGIPPWDIGRPQREFIRIAETGDIRGHVLDIGCGTGENALYLARRGCEVWGLDASATAIRKAGEKAARQGTKVTFMQRDALDLANLGLTFDAVIDSGLFHVFSDGERPRFVRGLHRVLRPGGTYFMLCFSEQEPGTWGPRRVRQDEIHAAFGTGWRVNYIREAVFETRLETAEVRAWLSSIVRL